VDLLESLALAGLGAVAVTFGAVASIVRSATGSEDERSQERDVTAVVAGAGLGVASELLRTAASVVDAAIGSLRPVGAAGAAVMEPMRRGADSLLRRWDATWEAERPAAESLATAVATEATTRAVVAVLDQLDLTQLVIDRVDLDEVAATLDVDAVAARVDVDRLLERIDMDILADRIDVERIVARLDLSAIALDVIDRIDLPEIIRASGDAVGSQTVRAARMDAIAADDAVTRIVDRVFRRRGAASTPGPGSP
jgi:hypothetical protein